MCEASYFSMRRLSPYQGTVQVVEMSDFRALSADGITWRVQLRLRDSRFASHGIWRERGYSSFTETPQTEVYIQALKLRPGLPFPAADNLELWLLDSEQKLPLALLTSTLPRHKPVAIDHAVWNATTVTRSEFVSAGMTECIDLKTNHIHVPHTEILQRSMRVASGVMASAQWFLRGEEGGGAGSSACYLDPALENRVLHNDCFPELLIKEQGWESDRERQLVFDYHDWLAPYLLTHDSLSAATRDRLEHAACKRAQQLYELRHIIPCILNKETVEVAMVAGKLQQSR